MLRRVRNEFFPSAAAVTRVCLIYDLYARVCMCVHVCVSLRVCMCIIFHHNITRACAHTRSDIISTFWLEASFYRVCGRIYAFKRSETIRSGARRARGFIISGITEEKSRAGGGGVTMSGKNPSVAA